MARTTEDESITAWEVIDDCAWTYLADHDEDPESGPKEPHDGYSASDYFTLSSNTLFPSRAEALAALRTAYKGPDCYGIGLEIPEE